MGILEFLLTPLSRNQKVDDIREYNSLKNYYSNTDGFEVEENGEGCLWVYSNDKKLSYFINLDFVEYSTFNIINNQA